MTLNLNSTMTWLIVFTYLALTVLMTAVVCWTFIRTGHPSTWQLTTLGSLSVGGFVLASAI
jgi:hypothetical protein